MKWIDFIEKLEEFINGQYIIGGDWVDFLKFLKKKYNEALEKYAGPYNKEELEKKKLQI
jgi:hypothetical protein